MSPRRRVLSSALIPILAFILALAAAPAHAQYYDAVRGSLGFTMDGIERSPGMLGMGRLTLVGDDLHTRLTLWDFAANPLGIIDADSTGTAEVFPSTSSLSNVHGLDGATDVTRQERAARETRFGYEIWRRMPKTAYGVSGNFGYLRTDVPYSLGAERRTSLRQPTAMPVLVGHVPFVRSPRWLYSARLYWAGESSLDDYRESVWNSEGIFVGLNGNDLGVPETFTPTDNKARTTGFGAGLGYDRGRALKGAVALDFLQNKLSGTVTDPKFEGQRDEKRPYRNLQGTFVGRIGRSLEWGIDGRDWTSHSESHWYFSLSGGVGADPVTGRGKLWERDEKGNALHSRLRWTHGALQFGAGLATQYRKVEITPPGLNDATSFNAYRNALQYHNPSVDFLMLPDSVTFQRDEYRTWDASGAMLLRLRQRGSWGIEFHRVRGLVQQDFSTSASLDGPRTVYAMAGQEGPLRLGWDVRTGVDMRLTQVLTGRAGYMYRWLDQDDYTKGNEFKAHTMTVGLGIRPSGASWSLDAGYAADWTRADFGSPLLPHGSRQQLATRLRWVF